MDLDELKQPPKLDSDSAPDFSTNIKSTHGTYGSWMFNFLIFLLMGAGGIIGVMWNDRKKGYNEGKADGLEMCKQKSDAYSDCIMDKLNYSHQIDSLKAVNLELERQNIMLQYAGKQLEHGSYNTVIIHSKNSDK